MSNESLDTGPQPETSVSQSVKEIVSEAGRIALAATASLAAIKVTGEVLGYGLPLHIETAMAATIGTYTAAKL